MPNLDDADLMHITGLHVPLITPLTRDGEVDLAALESLARSVLTGGADGIVALGTTGEPATLSESERGAVIDRIAGVCAEHRAQLTIGVGGNATNGTLAALADIDPRADFALVVVPYYTRPSEIGVYEHYRACAATSGVPLIAYDVPARTGRPLSAETLLAIAHLDGVTGFKHALGAITETTVCLLADAPADVSVLAGDDAFVGPMLAMGAAGAIVAGANIAPQHYAALIASWRSGDIELMRKLNGELARLSGALFAEPNPSVFKAVLARRGIIASSAVRLPLIAATESAVDAALAALPCPLVANA